MNLKTKEMKTKAYIVEVDEKGKETLWTIVAKMMNELIVTNEVTGISRTINMNETQVIVRL